MNTTGNPLNPVNMLILNPNVIVVCNQYSTLEKLFSPSSVQITLGTTEITEKGSTRIRAKRIAIPISTQKNIKVDLALVQLSRPVVFSEFIIPICLPTKTFRPFSPSNCETVGWRTGKSKRYELLLKPFKLTFSRRPKFSTNYR